LVPTPSDLGPLDVCGGFDVSDLRITHGRKLATSSCCVMAQAGEKAPTITRAREGLLAQT